MDFSYEGEYISNFEDMDFVIRLSHTSENFHRDKIASRWSSPNLPIPQIIKIDRYQNYHYAISPYFSGVAFESLSIADLEQTIPNFISMMTALQTVNLDSFTGYGTITPAGKGAFGSWSEALLDVNSDRPDNLVHGWKKKLAEIPETYNKYEWFYKQLEKLVKYCPEHKRVIHSDLLYQNLLVHNHKINAVLDWGCSMFGDPVYDIAIFDFFEPWFPAFTQVNLIPRMRQSFLEQSPDNRHSFEERMVACQIHLTLGNIMFCVSSEGKFDFNEHIDRLEEILNKTTR
jgi:hygromycin-B 4-O-kinase